MTHDSKVTCLDDNCNAAVGSRVVELASMSNAITVPLCSDTPASSVCHTCSIYVVRSQSLTALFLFAPVLAAERQLRGPGSADVVHSSGEHRLTLTMTALLSFWCRHLSAFLFRASRAKPKSQAPAKRAAPCLAGLLADDC